MSNAETLRALFAAIEAQDWATATDLVGEEFQVFGQSPSPQGKDGWLERHRQLAVALPDFRYNAVNFNEENDEATAFIQITGTHDGQLDLPDLGVEAMAATGKRVDLPQEMVIAKVEGGQVVNLVVHGPDHGGVPGILEQLGAG